MGRTDRGYRKRCRRYDVPWDAHYLTFSCYRRQPFFSGSRAAAWFLELLDEARRKVGFDLWAYVVMPEHVHLLVWPHEGTSIGSLLWAVKRPLSQRVLKWVLRNAPEFLSRMEQRRPSGRTIRRFWQAGGGYDRNLWTAREIHEKLHYIHDNPRRRGLVASHGDWPWTSYRAWENGTDEPLRLDVESLPTLAR
jgi:putative transposase